MAKSAISLIAFLVASILNFTSANAIDLVKQGRTRLSGSVFHYRIIAVGSNKRLIEVVHNKEKYDGALAAMSFRDRHLQVFKMVAGLIKESCTVTSLGNITLSKDPEQDADPHAEHPQYFSWEYSCK
jgi:pyruvate carboxylase